MILLLAGTGDGRELAATLTRQGYEIIVSVTTEYGKMLLDNQGDLVNDLRLDAEGMASVIQSHHIHCIVDASHPYAVNASRNAMTAARTAGIVYIRYERPEVLLPTYDKLFLVDCYEAAAAKAATAGNTVFLTTGSRHVKLFTQHRALSNHRLIARVLPQIASIEECVAAGLVPKDIIAVQGPFSHEFNKAMFLAYQAEVVVMKNSGYVGGTDTKLTAAEELGLSVIVIDKPKLQYGRVAQSFAAVRQCLKEVL